MLIGYKDDLDKHLAQAYAATGVVHIIAISGLHLGLIYWLLNLLTKPLDQLKRLRYIKPLIIITGLWLFSFAAGASPSVLRAALMFTCIVIGNSLSKKLPYTIRSQLPLFCCCASIPSGCGMPASNSLMPPCSAS